MIGLEPVMRLDRDLAQAARTLGREETRFLVDAYYQIQEYRKASANQVRSLVDQTTPEPCDVLRWLHAQQEVLESQIRRALDKWTDDDPTSAWAKSICGIGPVIAAGLAAHIKIESAPTVGHVWNFAGLNPGREWGKGEKRPWNAQLKTLCWKIGESFVKVSGNEHDFYGQYYLRRKAEEQARNEAGEFAGQAAEKLKRFRIGKDTAAHAVYESGKLPPAHLHARAKRWAVKLFLSHYHHVAYRYCYGYDPVKPYAIAILGHGDYIAPPNFPWN